MRRTVLIVLVLLAGVAIGAAAPEEVKKKFPWASDELNKEVTITELEWRCATNAIIQPDKPHRLSNEFDLVQLEPEIGDDGILIRCNVSPRIKIGPKHPNWSRVIELNTKYALREANKRFVGRKQQDDWAGMKLLFSVDGRPVATRDASALVMK